jgi:hypothetical protein
MAKASSEGMSTTARERTILAVGIIGAAVLILGMCFLAATAAARHDSAQCEQYKSGKLGDIPVKCAHYFMSRTNG